MHGEIYTSSPPSSPDTRSGLSGTASAKETVADTETVSGEVRKEQIELDDPIGTAHHDDSQR